MSNRFIEIAIVCNSSFLQLKKFGLVYELKVITER